MRSEKEIKDRLGWLPKSDANDRYTPCISTLLWALGEDLEGCLKEERE